MLQDAFLLVPARDKRKTALVNILVALHARTLANNGRCDQVKRPARFSFDKSFLYT